MYTLERYRPTVVDLFAGAGGLSLGFEAAGFDVVASVEIDPVHCAVHEFNFPKTKTICANIAGITGDEIVAIANVRSEIDVVVGGAPCQGFSLIGKRALDDPRNQLVYHYIRLVSEIQPKYFVFENVKGITVGEHKKFLNEMIEEFRKIGYQILLDYRVLNARDYGVPQDRKRLFLIGARSDQKLPSYPEPSKTVQTVWDAISDLPNADEFERLEWTDSIEVEFESFSDYQRILRGLKQDPTDFSYRRKWNKSLLTSSMTTRHTEQSKQRFLDTKNGETEKISRFLKLSPEGVCNTLRAGTNKDRGAYTSPRPIHPTFPRVITVREAARLHSYPDWFRFHVTKWHGFRQVGNSVPPLLGRAVGSVVMDALGMIPFVPSETLALGQEKLLTMDLSNAAKYFTVDSNVIANRNRTLQGSFLWEKKKISTAL